MRKLPIVAVLALFIAFLMAIGILLEAARGPVIVLPLALVPLASAIGILRRRVWSAWGMAFYLGAQLVLLPLMISRARGDVSIKRQMLVTGILSLAGVVLFYLAGRALAKDGAQRGHPLPWILIAALVTVPLFLFEPFVVPTGAMEPTILVGDRLVARRWPQSTAQRGDVFAVVYPIDRRQTFLKRVVGIPGDRIRIVHKTLYLNGAPLNEPYVVHHADYEDTYRDNFPTDPNTPLYAPAMKMLQEDVKNGELVVPAGKYFVLGDNRDQSLDSRYWGFVEQADLIGRPLFIYDSAEQTTEQATQGASGSRGRTRWERLFKSIR